MTSLKASVRDLLQQFAATQQATGEHVAVDIFRVLHEESQLLYESHCIRDLMDQDPFHCYQEHEEWRAGIESFKQSIQVVSCHRLERGDDYCLNQAIVQCHGPSGSGAGTSASSINGTVSSPKNKKQKRQRQNIAATNKVNTIIQLHFRYERDPATETSATSIWYSIDLSKDYGPKQNILTIRVWADGNKPSQLPAVSVDDQAGMGDDDDDDDDDDWEDIDSDDDEVKNETHKKDKKSKTDHPGKNKSKASKPSSNKSKNSKNDEAEDNTKLANQQEEEEEEDLPSRDRYACFVDPDVLQSFQQHSGLTALDEATAFFTLMTFPFYQNEFDLVGFVLDSVFAYDERPDDDEDNAGFEDESDKD